MRSKCGEGLMTPLSWERLWKSSTELCRLLVIPPATDKDEDRGKEEPENMGIRIIIIRNLINLVKY